MRAWPPLQVLLVLAALGLLAIPLVRLTGEQATVAVEAAPPAEEGAAVPGYVVVRFVHPPERARLSSGTQVLWEGRGDDEQEAALPLEGDRLELHLEVRWPPGTPRTIAEIEVAPDGREPVKATVWGKGDLDEFVHLEFRE
jgi:hypothetical protein